MNERLDEYKGNALLENQKVYRKIQLNYTRNKRLDHTQLLDEAAASFRYEDCKDEYWNPEEFSLLYLSTAIHPGTIKRGACKLFWRLPPESIAASAPDVFSAGMNRGQRWYCQQFYPMVVFDKLKIKP